MFCQGLVWFGLIFLTKFVAVECVWEREIKRDWVGWVRGGG